MVGDVWLCGGQSNMGLPLRFMLNGAEEAKAANCPNIRFFTVAGHPAYGHTDVVQGKWSAFSPETADWVSAVAYNFARRIQQDSHAPIGLVFDDVGGTPAGAWTSAEALRPLKDFDVPLAELARLTAAGAPEYGNFVMHWYDEYDIGIKGNWASPDFDDSAGRRLEFPVVSLNSECRPLQQWRGFARRSCSRIRFLRAGPYWILASSSAWIRPLSTERKFAPVRGLKTLGPTLCGLECSNLDPT